ADGMLTRNGLIDITPPFLARGYEIVKRRDTTTLSGRARWRHGYGAWLRMGCLCCHITAEGDTLARLRVTMRSCGHSRLNMSPACCERIVNGTLPRDVA